MFVARGAHPCLLSSSGSCPGELERRAQLLSAGEDLILRGGKTQTQISEAKNSSKHFPTAPTAKYFCVCTKAAAKQDTGGIFNKGIV